MVAPFEIEFPPSATGIASSPVVVADESAGAVELYWTRHDPAGPGGAKRLLLINGLGSPLVSFDEGFVSELVDRGFSVVRFDNRDVGRSGRIREDRKAETYRFDRPLYTLVEMANDATAVLDAVGWETAHVLGQSMGGMIAQQLAISHPDRVRSLISFMSSTGNREYGRATDEAHAALIRPAPRDREAWIEYTVETASVWATPDSWDPEAVRRRAARKFDYGIDVFGTGRQYRAVLASGARDDQLRRLTVPTLVIHGSADTLIQPDGGRRTAEVVPDARYVELDGFGHDLPPSRWPLVTDTVASFVDDVDRSV